MTRCFHCGAAISDGKEIRVKSQVYHSGCVPKGGEK